MKKLFTLFALMCMVCTGAWAQTTWSHTDIVNGTKIQFRSYWVNTNYLGVQSGKTQLETTSSQTTKFIIVEAETAGQFYLYDAVTKRFAGRAQGHDQTIPATASAAEAGLYSFVASTTGDGSGKDNTTPRFCIQCMNPVNANGVMVHHSGGSMAKSYGNASTTNYGGNAWHIYSLETATQDEKNEALDKILADQISTVQETVNTMYDNRGKVGYPNDMESIAEYYGEHKVNSTNLSTVQAAINALYTSDNVNLPEDGKAYKISAVHVNADGSIKNSYQLYTNAGGEIRCAANGVVADNALFFARNVGDKVVLVNGNGNYMIWSCDDNTKTQDKRGFTTEYDAVRNPLTIAHANKTHDNNYAGVNALTDVQLFGKLQIQGVGKTTSQTWTLIYNPNASDQNYKFVAGTSGNKYYGDGAHTFLFQFEEVTNPNTFTLSNPNPYGTASLDGKSVGTFSAPYNVKLPSTVTAYVAASREDYLVSLEPIEGNVVPANTGVLLYAEGGEEYHAELAVPAAETMPTTIPSNNFVAVVNGTIAEGSYVLAFDYNGVGFYPRANSEVVHNKAYLNPDFANGVRGFVFDNEDGFTTGIATPVAQQSTTTFDLAGRRVSSAVKGISICNGKKVIR